MNKPSFVISCPYDTYSGYGARARDIVKSIIELDKYDVKLLSQKWGNTPLDFCFENEEWSFLNKLRIPGIQNGQKPDVWMQITIPTEFAPVGKFNIGCTAGIESTGCAAPWIEGLNRMDINFVSSNHSKKVFEEIKFEKRNKQTNVVEGVVKLQKPIEVIFEGFNEDTYKYLKPSEISLDLSSIKEQFNFLFVGHWMQGALGHDRKNVGAMIKYFYDTFNNKKQQPGLILKTSMGRNSYLSREQILDKILQIKKTYPTNTSFPNVYVLNGSLSDKEMNELYNHPKVKAMVSITKGEGFGRPLLEFCLSKKPLIVSSWSGHVDFCQPENVAMLGGNLENVHESAANQWLLKETKWFQVDPGQIKTAYKDVFNKYKQYAVKGKKQGFYIKENFNWNKMKELVGNVLDKNIPDFPKQVELKMPVGNLPKLK
jgi:glycosyltransferase involved in cell wall biosynthesis